MNRPDDIAFQYSSQHLNLAIRLLSEGSDLSHATVLIEGNRMSLKMLGELLIALSNDPLDDGFQMSHLGAGAKHFAADSNLGLYLHRLPA